MATIQGRSHSKAVVYTKMVSFLPTTNLMIFFSRGSLKRMFCFWVTSGVNFKLTFLEVGLPSHRKTAIKSNQYETHIGCFLPIQRLVPMKNSNDSH